MCKLSGIDISQEDRDLHYDITVVHGDVGLKIAVTEAGWRYALDQAPGFLERQIHGAFREHERKQASG